MLTGRKPVTPLAAVNGNKNPYQMNAEQRLVTNDLRPQLSNRTLWIEPKIEQLRADDSSQIGKDGPTAGGGAYLRELGKENCFVFVLRVALGNIDAPRAVET